MYPWEPQEKERLSAMKGLKKGSTRSAAAILSAALILTVGAGGCGKAEGEGGTDLENRVPGSGYTNHIQGEPAGYDGEGTTVLSDNGGEAYFDNSTTIVLDGRTYDIAQREEEVNAITNIRAVEGYWIVTGHISPNTSYYGFYNTQTLQWEKEILGAGLTWYGAEEGEEDIPFSMDTVVYTMADELYDSNGRLVGKVDLDEKEHEYIYGLERSSEGVEVCILNDAVEERLVVVQVSLPDRS